MARKKSPQKSPKHSPKVTPVARRQFTTAEGEELILDATIQTFDAGFSIGAVISLDRITSGPLMEESVSPEPPESE